MERNIIEKGKERIGQDEIYMYSMELDRWDRKEIEGIDGMRRKEMDEMRQEVQEQDKMVQNGKGRELKGSLGIIFYFDNKIQILNIVLFCINQFVDNIFVNEIIFRNNC